MSKLRVHCFSVSADGYGAGPNQSEAHPLGEGGMKLHKWHLLTRTFHQMHGMEGGVSGVDDDFVARGTEHIGAWILGRNMFGPIRGPWTNDEWKGWWGDNPPYHVPVFVLTHHPRPSIEMQGGTVFHFVTGDIHATLAAAREAAQGKDVRLGGGVSTLRQYLEAKLVDEMHLAVSPMVLGSGENLFAEMDLPGLGYRAARHVTTPLALHIVFDRDAEISDSNP